jgi:hypothetical protein
VGCLWAVLKLSSSDRACRAKIQVFYAISAPVTEDTIAAAIVLFEFEQLVQRHTEDFAKKHPIHPGMTNYGNMLDSTVSRLLEYGPTAAKEVGKAFSIVGTIPGEIFSPSSILAREAFDNLGNDQPLPCP